ncbi:MAG: hypothetical protein EAZ91_21550 [Cytophagales bacterium]|nr:MAG: hypothetical protein EAZ91_21550 [Cytophagales bacterium]
MRPERERKLIARFWWLGGLGGLLLGSGLATLLHGSHLKDAGDSTWFWVSTGGFALIMTGIGSIGHANRFRTLADVYRILRDSQEQSKQR